MSKDKANEFAIPSPEENTFDVRLLQKRVEHGFLTEAAIKSFVTSLPAEADYSFSEHDVLSKEDS